jgi:glycosyltransferase involved in cell wall biosynthesis
MRDYDAIAVPSRGLETGPLVVLEAFAAGRPVLGADLGGIAELVSHDVDGLLIAPNNSSIWASAIAELASDPRRIQRLAAGIRAPRTMEDAAGEMVTLYRGLTTQAN